MDIASPSTEQPQSSPPPEATLRAAQSPSDAMMAAYIGYLAGYFEIGRLAAARRLARSGLHTPLLNDA
jgi:hypothetical protein